MNTFMLQRALDEAGIPADELDPQIIISRRFSDHKSYWVVYFAAATAQAFEMPGEIDLEKVMDVAAVVARWDVGMMEHESMSGDTVRTVKWAAANMLPCPLKQIIDSVYGPTK